MFSGRDMKSQTAHGRRHSREGSKESGSILGTGTVCGSAALSSPELLTGRPVLPAPGAQEATAHCCGRCPPEAHSQGAHQRVPGLPSPSLQPGFTTIREQLNQQRCSALHMTPPAPAMSAITPFRVYYPF